MHFPVLLISILLILGCGRTAENSSPERAPNIILIITDDQGWGDVSHHGNNNLHTPHIDQLAAEGASFTNFFVQPVCSPSRAELLTGRYARRLGVYSTSAGGERLNLGEQTLADVFRQAGYATAAYGKWHNGSQPPYHPNARGFDDFYGFTSGHWGSYFSPMLEHNGEVVRGEGYLPDDLTGRAIQFITARKDQPFFVFLSLNTPHSPMQVPDAYWERFREKPLLKRHRDSTLEDTAFTRAALAMVENIDDNVGRIRNALEALRLQENTILLFLSDNGPNSYRWNGGMRGRKGSTDEGGVKVPSYIQWKGHIPAAKQIGQIAGAIDLLPTLASLAGIDYQPPRPLDGKDLSPLLFGTAEGWQDRMLMSHWNGATSVRSQQYRLDNQGRLYHMGLDPGQDGDIAAEFAVLADSMSRVKQQWLQSIRALSATDDTRPLPVGHPEYPITHLPARDAIGHGGIERSNQYPNCSYLTRWNQLDAYISWEVEVLSEGNFEAELYYSCAAENTGATVALEWGEESLPKTISEAHDPPLEGMEHDRYPRMESYIKDFKPLSMGRIHLRKGTGSLRLRVLEMTGGGVIDFRLLVLKRVP